MVTDWECGQILVHLSDEIAERSQDIEQSHPEVYAMLQDIRLTIGDTFNKEPFKTSHGFGIADHGPEAYDRPATAVIRTQSDGGK